MGYYGIERSEEYVLEHGLWGKKATKYIKKKLINGKWRYYYKDASAKTKYAVKRVKQGAEEILNNVKKKAHDEVKHLKRKYDKDYQQKIYEDHVASRAAEASNTGRDYMQGKGKIYDYTLKYNPSVYDEYKTGNEYKYGSKIYGNNLGKRLDSHNTITSKYYDAKYDDFKRQLRRPHNYSINHRKKKKG